MTFELCIPAYNEAPIIADALRKVRGALTDAELAHTVLVVVDNASVDGTSAAAHESGVPRVLVHTLAARGKGVAIRFAAQASQADYFGFIDADLSAHPREIPQMLALVTGGGADIAIGSRLLDPSSVRRGTARSWSSRMFNALRRLVLGIDVADSQCGLKIMNARGRTVLAACVEEGWFLDLEFLARAERAGLVIREVPVDWDEHRYQDRAAKLSVLRDGFGAIAAMLRIRGRLN